MLRPRGRFPPTRRVRKRAEYQEIQRTARRVSTPRFVLLLSARAEQDGARLGIVVSRKVGCAVVRNRAKRLIREAFRATPELFGPDLDVVVIVKRSTGDAVLAEVVAEWQAVARMLQKRTEDARADRARRAAAPSAPGSEAGGAREKARDSRGP
ncbi:MAG: ribonuclease P protein component [Myxococcales bacterium]|nr:ribonuclease P protein component [Myxococcales bacterium]